MSADDDELRTCKCGDEIDEDENTADVIITWHDDSAEDRVDYRNEYRLHSGCAHRLRRGRITAPDVMETTENEAYCAVCAGYPDEMVDKTGEYVHLYIETHDQPLRDLEYIFHVECWEEKRAEWVATFHDEDDDE